MKKIFPIEKKARYFSIETYRGTRIMHFFFYLFLLTFLGLRLFGQESFWYYKALGDHYRSIGLWSKASISYDRSIHIKEDCGECYYWNAWLHLKQDLPLYALLEIEKTKDFSSSLSLVSMKYDLDFLEVEIYSALEQSQKVESLLNQMIQEIRANLLKINTTQEERNDWNHYLGKAYYFKGIYLYDRDPRDRARWFEQSSKLKYKTDFALYYQYLLYRNLLEYTRARAALKLALDQNPNILLDFQIQPNKR